MKSRLVATIAIFLVITSFYSPANAIFGLSACEKATKGIIAEEKIGLESWKYFNQMVKSHNKDANWNVPLADALAEVYKSDKTVWEIAQKNSKCYTPAQVAEIRRQLSWTNKTISDYKAILKNQNFKTYTFDWSIYYKKYNSAITILKEVKSVPAPTSSGAGNNA
jgi:hypothetical protein